MLDSLNDTGTFYIDQPRITRPPARQLEGLRDGQPAEQPDRHRPALPEQSAAEAGIRSYHPAVDGESTQGWPADKAVLKIRGDKEQ
jgi:hypothetical protein